jgi:hypothetical protein
VGTPSTLQDWPTVTEAARRAVFSRWTLVVGLFVLPMTALATWLIHIDPAKASADPVAPLLGVSGTLVALVIPAAALAGDYVEKRRQSWIDRLVQLWIQSKTGNAPPTEVQGALLDEARYGRKKLETLHELAIPFWRGLILCVAGFPLAVAAMFHPTLTIAPILHSTAIPIWEGLAGLVSGVTIIGVLLLMPFGWQVVRLEGMRQLSDLFESLEQEAKRGSPTGPMVAMSQIGAGPQLASDSRCRCAFACTITGPSVIKTGERRRYVLSIAGPAMTAGCKENSFQHTQTVWETHGGDRVELARTDKDCADVEVKPDATPGTFTLSASPKGHCACVAENTRTEPCACPRDEVVVTADA